MTAQGKLKGTMSLQAPIIEFPNFQIQLQIYFVSFFTFQEDRFFLIHVGWHTS